MKWSIIPVLFVLIYGCNHRAMTKEEALKRKDSLRNVLLNLERAYSASSLKKGFYQARLDYVCDSSIDILEGAYPIRGKIELREWTDMHPDSTFTLEWKPERADIAESGDLGYTFGDWVLHGKTRVGKDTTLYGNYVTVWQKQADSTWKYLIDGGSDTPKPQE